jgi:adenylate cyclase
MNSEKMKRKLSAILSADVKGYSRLMSVDEEATVRTLNTYEQAMENLIRQYGGRVVGARGDNPLAEFASGESIRCLLLIVPPQSGFQVIDRAGLIDLIGFEGWERLER